ncbi:MAG: hypothetical protein FD123_573 [Bacteroidetes bacterium]|nr:MAG: hypothetical protein FD123_573 [Bacteroidota bacterium]
MAEQLDIDALFRNAQERRAAEPPPQAWDRIRETMDVDDTWKRISATLDAQAEKSRRRFALIFVSCCLLAAFTFGMHLFNTSRTGADGISLAMHNPGLPVKQSTVTAESNDDPGAIPARTRRVATFDFNNPVKINIGPGLGDKIKTDAGNTAGASNRTGTTGTSNAGSTAGVSKKQGIPKSGKAEPVIAASTKDSILFSFLLLSRPVNILFAQNANDSLAIDATKLDSALKENNPLSRFSVFAFGGGRMNWLLNSGDFITPQTDSTGLTLSDKLSFSTVAGAGLAYQLRPRLGLNASFYLLSGGGQAITQTQANKSVTEELRLKYSSVSLWTGVQVGRGRATGNFGTYGTIISGLNFSYLRKYNELVSSARNIRAANSYKNYDAGVFLGYAQHFRFGRRFELIPSVAWHQGLVNITRRPDKLPASFSRAFNSGVEGQVALRYTF